MAASAIQKQQQQQQQQQQRRRNRSSKMRTASSLSSSVALMAVAVLVGALSRTHHVSAFSSVRSKTVTASSRLQYRRGDAYDKWDYYIATTTTGDEATDTATATATKVEQQHQLQLQRQLEQQQLEQQQLEQLQQLQAQVDEYISYHNKRYHNSVTITAPSSSTAILYPITKQHHYRRSILQNIATAAILLPHLDAGGITKLASLVVLVRPWLWRGGGGGSA